ncbi:MAG TPA: SNF2-related protein, partial [Candidatus Binatia bacterium]|nr:SNF2-related protein [Candidatus Binatia bacterium]
MILVNPFEKDPDETYRAYQRFRKRNEYDKAYRCIENLLKRFPDDMELLEEIVALALGQMRDPGLARPWLMRRIKLASYWRDYALLSEIEAVSGNLTKARENLGLATKLQKRQRFFMDSPREVREALDRARNLIRLQEHNRWVERISSQGKIQRPAGEREVPAPGGPAKLSTVTEEKKEPRLDKSEAPVATTPPVVSALAPYRAPLRFAPPDFEVMNAMLQSRGTLKECQLRVEYAHLDVQRGFDDLLCVNKIKGVDRYWYQLETAKKVLKYFHGRVLLCDEVGLGKTIEAGMLMKEYLLRGMIKNILILTPAPLVSQWQEEMAQKFDIVFATTDDPLFSADPDRFWRGSFIIA